MQAVGVCDSTYSWLQGPPPGTGGGPGGTAMRVTCVAGKVFEVHALHAAAGARLACHAHCMWVAGPSGALILAWLH